MKETLLLCFSQNWYISRSSQSTQLKKCPNFGLWDPSKISKVSRNGCRNLQAVPKVSNRCLFLFFLSACPFAVTLRNRKQSGWKNLKSQSFRNPWLQPQPLPSNCRSPGNKMPGNQQPSGSSLPQWRPVYPVISKSTATPPSVHSAKPRAAPATPRSQRESQTSKQSEGAGVRESSLWHQAHDRRSPKPNVWILLGSCLIV